MAKEQFQSRGGFVLACVGAAVGLGNALRFPGLCAKFGGGTYLLIYFVALVALGIPLLNAEIALGRKYRGGAPAVFSAMRRGADKVGWAACANSFVTAVLYAGLAGWILVEAIQIVPLSSVAPVLPQDEIGDYFFQHVLSARSDGVISDLSVVVLFAIAVCWAVMFICLKGGANSLAKAARFTVFVPVILLFCMAVRGFFFSNAGQALSALFLPDLSALSSPELWLSALGQVFFSLSVAVGIMPAYGSYLPEGTNIFRCSLLIAAADFLVSVLASVVMFTTLYGCGLEKSIGSSGIITAFSVYPVAITMLFGGNTALNAAVGVVFYLSLGMMAVQSAVSMLEAAVSPLSTRFAFRKKRLAGAVCLIGVALCPVFATTAGVMAVEISDRFVNFYDVLLLCIAECLILGGSKELDGLAGEINRFSNRLQLPQGLLKVSVKYLSPAVLLSLTVLEIIRLCRQGAGYPLWALAGFGWGLSLAIFAVGLLLSCLSRPRECGSGKTVAGGRISDRIGM